MNQSHATRPASEQTLKSVQTDIAGIKAKTDNLDVPLSTVAKEATLAAGFGAAGANPEVGSGISGWLRSIYNKLAGTLQVSSAHQPFYQSRFARILARQFQENEEVRDDFPVSYDQSSFAAIGLAPEGSEEDQAVWSVVRFYFDVNGNINRRRFKAGLKWTERAIESNWP